MRIFAISMQRILAPVTPEGLLVNDVSNPLAIDRDTTRFTWMSQDGSRGEIQPAYQILVASSADRLEGPGEKHGG